MGVAKVEYYGRTLIDLTGDSVNPDVLAEGETAHDANGDLIVGRGVLNKGNFANALVGNVTGEIVSMDDVSPLEHNVRIKLMSKNIIPYPFSRTTATINGVTFTDNGDGTITVNGTATANVVYYFSHHMTNPIAFPKGVYTLSGAPDGSEVNTYHLGIRKRNSGALEEWAVYASGRSMEMDLLESVYVVVIKGVTANNLLFKPQLELGTTATTYTPYVADNTEVTVKSCGKNLIPFPYRDLPEGAGTRVSGGGVTFTVHEDGTITANGTSTSSSYFTMCQKFFPVGTYRLGNWGGNAPQGAYIYIANKDYSFFKICNTSGYTIEISKADIYDIVISFNAGSVANNKLIKPQFEFGTITTDYESYIEGEEITTTLAEGAEFTSIAPNMTIYTDKEGAIIECSYNKDTNIVIEKLTQAIIALGGNV